MYVDATLGLGGHSEEILKRVGAQGRVIGIDRDEEALKMATARLNDGRLVAKKGRFSDIENLLASEGIEQVDGILFDLGVSMMQLKDLGRGFSFHSAERLDMRMDKGTGISAWDVVNGYPEKELIRILREYGEERAAARIAKAIVRYRENRSVDTCDELADVVSRAVGGRGRVHPATRTFQALRIEVNGEIEELRQGLASSLRMMKKGGRLCVISYHSLEDRIVKHFIRDNVQKGALKALTKKPLSPSLDELRENPSSRSAKLRGAERL